MPNTFVVSDTHFGHALMATGRHEDGTPLRPWQTVEEHDEALIDRWNAVVQPHDRVYHLGDVTMKKRGLPQLARLHGRKCLIKGNHDVLRLRDYQPYFDDVRAYRVFTDTPVRMILSHVPVHPQSLQRFRANVHGHLHHALVLGSDGLPDPRYRNVCLEHTDYAPLAFDQLLTELAV